MRLDVWVVGVSMALAVTGCAGRVASTFADMGQRVPPGTTVYVTTAAGNEVKGELATVSGSSMTVSLPDTSTRDFSETDVTRVRAKDSLWNGMLIGAAVGGVFTLALNDESCTAPSASPGCQKVSRGAGVAIGTAMGAALGTGLDALRHRRVFRGARSTGRASLFFAPVVTPNVAGIWVSSRF